MVNANITGAHPLCNNEGDSVLRLVSLFFNFTRNVLHRKEALSRINQTVSQLNLRMDFSGKCGLFKHRARSKHYLLMVKIALSRAIIIRANQTMEIDQLYNGCNKKSEPVIGSSLFKLPYLLCRSLFYESLTEPYDGLYLAS